MENNMNILDNNNPEYTHCNVICKTIFQQVLFKFVFSFFVISSNVIPRNSPKLKVGVLVFLLLKWVKMVMIEELK